MHAAILRAALLLAQFLAAPAPPVVEQTVEMVSVAHVADGAEMIFFWAFVQGEVACLDHRWLATDMAVHRAGDEWVLAWQDDGEYCYRVIRTRFWIETWETSSPVAEMKQRAWFRQLLCPGLAQPRRAER